MEVHHQEEHDPVSALNSTADALPGLGIVAAVLGAVINNKVFSGPPEEIGKRLRRHWWELPSGYFDVLRILWAYGCADVS